jgi:serine protease Do
MYESEISTPAWTQGFAWLVTGVLGGVLIGVLVFRTAPEPVGWTSYAGVYQAVAPSVVNVAVDGDSLGVGSGFAVGTNKVVTARHLVQGADSISVLGLDGLEYEAAVLGSDARTDLALLDVPGASLQPVRLGRSHTLMVGDTVLAIGNPYGLGHSLAQGVVGGQQRSMDGGDGSAAFVQLSIPLNPGNSGGPILDDSGLVVGVLAGTHAQGQAIAFAVPVDVLSAALPALLRGDELTRAWMGVRGFAATQGLQLEAVVSGGPADRAGIRIGDTLSTVGDLPVLTPDAFNDVLSALPPHGKVAVVLLRDGERLAIPVLLADRASRSVVASGMTMRAAPGAGGEVVAVRPGSRADRAGVFEGDVIRSVSGFVVQSPADVQDLLAGRNAVRLELVREGTVMAVTLGQLTP